MYCQICILHNYDCQGRDLASGRRGAPAEAPSAISCRVINIMNINSHVNIAIDNITINSIIKQYIYIYIYLITHISSLIVLILSSRSAAGSNEWYRDVALPTY